MKINKVLGMNNEEIMFGENSFSCMFVLSTSYSNIGLIEFCNSEVYSLLGYTES